MLIRQHEKVERELRRIQLAKSTREEPACEGDDRHIPSYHCYHPTCTKQHNKTVQFLVFKKCPEGKEVQRKQLSVAELCQACEDARLLERPHNRLPMVLRALDDPWGWEEDVLISFRSLFDETAQLLAMLHAELEERQRDGTLPDCGSVYGHGFDTTLGELIRSLWLADLPSDIGYYKGVAAEARCIAEHMLLGASERCSQRHGKTAPDKARAIAEQFPSAAFQEPCLVVWDYSSASGLHALLIGDQFVQARNSGNNCIIICRAVVQACALYSQFVQRLHGVAAYDDEKVNGLQVNFQAYLAVLKAKLLRRIPGIHSCCEDIKAAVAKCAVLKDELQLLTSWCESLAALMEEKLKHTKPLRPADLHMVDELNGALQDLFGLVNGYAVLSKELQLQSVIESFEDDTRCLLGVYDTLKRLAEKLGPATGLAQALQQARDDRQELFGSLQDKSLKGELRGCALWSEVARSACSGISENEMEKLLAFISATTRPGSHLKIHHADMRLLWYTSEAFKKFSRGSIAYKPPEEVDWGSFRDAFPRDLQQFLDTKSYRTVGDWIEGVRWSTIQASVIKVAGRERLYFPGLPPAHDGKTFDYDAKLAAVEVDVAFDKHRDVLGALKKCIEEAGHIDSPVKTPTKIGCNIQ